MVQKLFNGKNNNILIIGEKNQNTTIISLQPYEFNNIEKQKLNSYQSNLGETEYNEIRNPEDLLYLMNNQVNLLSKNFVITNNLNMDG